MNHFFVNEYSGFSFDLKIEMIHLLSGFNEKMNIKIVSSRATLTLNVVKKKKRNLMYGRLI